MGRGAWWAAVHGVAKSQTRLRDFTFTSHFHALEKEMATHSSILAWRIPGTGKPGGLPSLGSHRVGHNWTTNTFIFFIKNRCKLRKARHLVKLSHDSSIIHSTNTRQVSMFLGKSKVLGSLLPGVYTSISRRNKNILCTCGQLYYNLANNLLCSFLSLPQFLPHWLGT